MNDPWFAMNGVRVSALRVVPTIVEQGWDYDVRTTDLTTRLGRWSLRVDLDKSDLADYAALVSNSTVTDLVFLDHDDHVRRGRAVLVSALRMGRGVIRLEWLGRGRLR